MELKEMVIKYFDKKVKVVCKDGNETTGIFNGYIAANDNEPEVDEITLDVNGMLVGIELPEIKSIQES